MTEPLGDRLLAAAGGATEHAVLVAPFIKFTAVSRLLGTLATSVRVDVVTRWRPAEVAAGVSDIEVLDAVAARPDGTVYLNHNLHAKYYRFDDQAYVGSANLTARALGWSEPRNIEILVPHAPLPDFEADLIDASIVATRETALAVAEAARMIPGPGMAPEVSSSAPVADTGPAGGDGLWLPATRHPQDLYLVYAGAVDTVSSTTHAAATADLAYLAPPEGLAADAFRAV